MDMYATPRLASGALFVHNDRILLVHKTYGIGWDIPGGYIERGESPASACQREIREELGLNRIVKKLLVLDWAPNEAEGDKILYVFYCGQLNGDECRLRVDGIEIDKTEWVGVDSLPDIVIPRLARRLAKAYEAYESGTVLYLEHGRLRTSQPLCAGQALAEGSDLPAGPSRRFRRRTFLMRLSCCRKCGPPLRLCPELAR